MSLKKKGGHKSERQVGGAKPREKDASLHTVLRLLLYSPCCGMLKFTCLRKVWKFLEKSLHKDLLWPRQSLNYESLEPGKMLFRNIAAYSPCLHPFVSAFTVAITLFLGALHCYIHAQRKLQTGLLLLTLMQY